MSMVDVSKKKSVYREAVAEGFIKLKPSTIKLIKEGKIAKGDPLSIAKLAGIMATKQTPSLIPLTHMLPLTHVEIDTSLKKSGITVRAKAKTVYKTGCEVDAMVGVFASLVTIFDCVKKYDPKAVISGVRVVKKIKKSQSE